MEEVQHFKFLGGIITRDGYHTKYIRARIANALTNKLGLEL